MMLQDGWNSSIRYVKNNFLDGKRTDSIKFLLGELSTNDVITSETIKRETLMNAEQNLSHYLPQALLLLSAILVLTLLMAPRLSFNLVIFCLVLIAALYSVIKLIMADSAEFVNFPTTYTLSKSRQMMK